MKIAVGLSGGVDSSVAALLLKEQGHEVVGLFMQNWHDTTGTLHGQCLWEDDWELARMVAQKLDIPVHFVDLSHEYRQRVVDYMFAEYEKGRTPNPDVLCNREIKFDAFLEKALALGVEKVATGHYCRVDQATLPNRTAQPKGADSVAHPTPEYRLLAGTDPGKDQSYFLCQLNQYQLSKAMFPIGHLLKPEVRRLAAAAQLPTADRKDSQGICFVGKVDLPVFLQQKLTAREGPVVEVFRDGTECVIGTHQGAQFYTIGQRKGLNIGGHREPLFIVATDVQTNTIYVGEGQDHPRLYRPDLWVRGEEIHWLRPSQEMRIGESRRYQARIRYRQPLQEATLTRTPEGMYMRFDNPQRGVTEGQFAAWYDGDELMGSGVITLPKQL